MIERFNFFDLYGYLFPGLALNLLFWGPLVGAGYVQLPSMPVTVLVLITLLVSYVLGLLLSSLGHVALPSTIRVGEQTRQPSDLLLDEEDTSLSASFKERLGKLIRADFDLGLCVPYVLTTAFQVEMGVDMRPLRNSR